ncbi:MAG TPA: uracil-DNA glycosylase [Pseudolabrys sp.]|nr:uracil-DNA glycosylase [Pseudolabrys sp.]
MIPSDRTTARALIDFYLEAGVDALVGEQPVDRFADEASASATGAPPPPERGRSIREADRVGAAETAAVHQAPPFPALSRKAGGSPTSASPPVAATLAPDAAAMEARQAAKSAQSLAELRAILENFDGCALKATATRLVFADGNPEARLMLVGEAPGRDEDIEGLPFVGRSGKLLDRMLAAIGLDRGQVYIANIVPWRPPGNRTPTPQESQICLPFVLRQIELADPDILICLGGPSAQTLLNIRDGITKTRGRWFPFDTGTREIRAMPTFHPAFLLRSPLQKRFAWRDFLAIKKALGG